ncbi:2-oxoacid:ferredoxin oxidoreductase subunit beta [Natronospira bacteriovora]|uniref:2-oxoacid:ferredoxin oxidoreductase subunit beta n=1 Tax=Natronospira bacteriovora TaxID=3069753 RepID=A0ABU0WAA5_9GAMM|nr:2-oxoacid:ferredoxin oxidoreductase subunit beta [Natronospira sp. AB-CW4]MDQ2070390.1 2-oxoacid:ferredoxin oxidoreductase subunit beta [Natronospira sp. AB-CW4]
MNLPIHSVDRPCKPKDYKSGLKPVWCPGCGDFGVLNAVTKALSTLAIPSHEVAFISGIGCSSRIPAYTRSYGFHGAHGRALPVATGLALSRPDLTVLAAGGDGDGFSIGGNHFLHACRRDANVTYLVMDNAVYGMTKGQPSPTTEAGWDESQMQPDGTDQAPFQPLEVALAAGCGFIARAFSGDPNGLAELISEGIRHPGFAFLQILSPCPTFRPEQMQYKKQVHAGFRETANRGEAYQQLLENDGFTTGLLYRQDVAHRAAPERPIEQLQEIEAAFQV